MKLRNLIKIILSLLITLSGLTSLLYLNINRKEVKESISKFNQKLIGKTTDKKKIVTNFGLKKY